MMPDLVQNLDKNKKISKLLLDIQPEKLLFRDKELADIEDSFKRFYNHDNPKNVLLHGVPGSGKTTAIRIIRRNQQNHCVYISGEQCNTAHSVLRGITDLTFNTRERLLSEAKLMLNKDKKIIIIDELNKMKRVEELKWLFNDLNTLFRDTGCTIILITNKNAYETERFIPKDAVDSLKLNKIEFKSYNPVEISGIIQDRLLQIEREYSLHAEIPEGFLSYLSALIVREHDGGIRTALYTLSECLISNDFSKENINKILKKIQGEDFEQGFLNLPEQEKKFLATVIYLNKGKNEPIYISNIVEKVTSIFPQRISQLLNNLEAQGYLTRDIPQIKGMGRHRFVKFTRQDIFEKISKLTENIVPLE